MGRGNSKIIKKKRYNSQENTISTLKTNENVTYAGACVGSFSISGSNSLW